MKRIVIMAISLLAFVCVIAAAPGSDEDPVVSKSYLDARLADLEENAGVFNVVDVKKGGWFIGRAGCEVILRAGAATAVSSDLGGLSDVTAGRDLAADEVIALNHHLIIPRDDRRGLHAGSDIVLLVKGRYSIE